ncbi:hypothetical protein KQI88_01525 [Alkaliphilus sp. MSJ-5]|uniref:Uncharacterized protein n=1 Tax=Alkaliphilus flagellatus TaxID=2841507 RepID=A0ABS6FXZ0_9FIRM|nr:hypothetical protein [Alkaliphilus flagellatus]MBU5675095.1 hypothetical protein [Alkaliphilus flagellatus]
MIYIRDEDNIEVIAEYVRQISNIFKDNIIANGNIANISYCRFKLK